MALETTRHLLAKAQELDAADQLAPFRECFFLPEGSLYLDGNSLELLSRDAEAAVVRALDAWRSLAIDGWTTQPQPWFYLGEELGAMQADLVGARSSEVVITGSITTNLHALLATFYQPTGQRTLARSRSSSASVAHRQPRRQDHPRAGRAGRTGVR